MTLTLGFARLIPCRGYMGMCHFFLEERERSKFSTGDSRTATLLRSSEKGMPDHRLVRIFTAVVVLMI